MSISGTAAIDSAADAVADFLRALINRFVPTRAPSAAGEKSVPIPALPPAAPPATTTIIYQTINQPVIERIVSEQAPSSGVSQSYLDARLNSLDQSLRQLIAQGAGMLIVSGPSAPVSVATFAQSQRIDNLANVTISNATVHGVSGLTAADIPTDITASNYLPLAGGTLTGSVTGTDLTLSGNLTVNGAQTLSGAITIPYLTATSSTASMFTGGLLALASTTIGNGTQAGGLTISGGATTTGNLLVQGATTLANATSTNFFSSVASSTSLYSQAASVGTFNASGAVTFTNLTGGLLYANGNGTLSSVATSTWTFASSTLLANNNTFSGTNAFGVLSATYASTTQIGSTGSAYFATAGGNVGIGTASPSQKLQVTGSTYISSGTLYLPNSISSRTSQIEFASMAGSVDLLGIPAVSSTYHLTSSSNTLRFWNDTYGEGLALNLGNVGIAQTSPTYKLDVTGNGHFTSLVDAANFVATSSTATSTFAGGLSVGSSAFNVMANGHVGIGTNNPAANLQIAKAYPADYSGTGLLITGTTESGDFSNGWGIDIQNVYAARIRLKGDTSGGRGSGIYIGNDTTNNPGAWIGFAGGYYIPWGTYSADSPNALYISSGKFNSGSYVPIIFNTGGHETVRIDTTGSVGIGTTSPSTTLQVHGVVTPDGDNTYSLGNATYRWSAVYSANGTIQTSDRRLKSDITALTYGLSDILELQPVSFTWTAHPEQGTKLGFIAQDVLPVMPAIVNVGDDAAHTLGLNYTEFIPAIVKAIQELSTKLDALAATIADFAESITTKLLTAGEIHTDKLCVQGTCVTGVQLAALLSQAGTAEIPISVSSPGATDLTNSGNPANANPGPNATASSTAPIIEINGENPAVIHVGDTYNDLGATIVAPDADKNLGIKTFLNGRLVSNIAVDTSEPTTDIIDYVVTSSSGLTSTSTRTVIIEASGATPGSAGALPVLDDAPPLAPDYDATTTLSALPA